jgi:hypothetical protein
MHAMIRILSPLLAAALAIAAAAAAAQDAPAADPAAPPMKILLAMSRTYSGCRSYRDTGKVKTRSVMEEGSFGSDVPFSTAFVRDGPFRFQFTDSGLGEASSVCILWWNGAEVQSWWDAKPGVRRSESLQQALDVASGISTGASLRVPGMLLPSVVGSGPPLIDPERIDDAVTGGASCFRIKGKSRATPYTETTGSSTVTVKDEAVTLWIDRATFLLRKVEEARTLDSYRSTRTTTYTPEINVDIPADQLAFNAPAAAPAVTPPTPTPRKGR